MLKSDTHTIAKLLDIDTSNIENISFTGIGTDTRQDLNNKLFIALSGENFNGADFIDKAETAGAVCAIVDKDTANNIPTLKAEDTLVALTAIAKYHLNNIKPMVIGITGSNGKTTTKNMLFNILSLSGKTLATKGNFNNHIGVPLTLLDLKDDHQYAVIEMGANHLGEIKHLRDIAKPDIAIVTNTIDAHIGEFGGFDNLVKAKGEIYSSDSQNIVNTQTTFTGDISFGDGGDIYPSNIKGNKFTLNIEDESIEVELQLIGRHNIDNALAASSCAYALGIDLDTIKQGLENTQAETGRLQIIKHKDMTIINDSYNANPHSAKAAITTLKEFSGEKVIVLGQMAELGEDSDNMHKEVGEIAKQNSDAFYSFGANTQNYATDNFTSYGQLAKHLLDRHQNSTILFKGSRVAKLEQIIEKICV